MCFYRIYRESFATLHPHRSDLISGHSHYRRLNNENWHNLIASVIQHILVDLKSVRLSRVHRIVLISARNVQIIHRGRQTPSSIYLSASNSCVVRYEVVSGECPSHTGMTAILNINKWLLGQVEYRSAHDAIRRSAVCAQTDDHVQHCKALHSTVPHLETGEMRYIHTYVYHNITAENHVIFKLIVSAQ